MALPTLNDVTAVDPVLQNMLVAYSQSQTRFAAGPGVPGLSMEEKSGTYYKFTKKYWFTDGLERRAPGAAFAKGVFGVETATYDTVQWALAKDIADEDRAGSQLPYDLETAAIRWLGQNNLIRQERQLATSAFGASIWDTTDNNSVTDWDDASGTPVDNVLLAIDTISDNTGMDANSMICGKIVYRGLLTNAQVEAALQYTTQLTVTARQQLLANVLGLDNLYVSRASYNSANIGQSGTYAPIIDDDALIYYNNPAATIFDVTAMRFFLWNPGGGAGQTSTVRVAENDSDTARIKAQWDLKLIATDCGYIFLDVV